MITLTFPSGVKNPVLVANRLLSEAQKGKLSAGRIPPWWLWRLFISAVLINPIPFFSRRWILLFSLSCQLFSGARSTRLGGQPWNTTVPFRENGYKLVLLHWPTINFYGNIWFILGFFSPSIEFSLSAYKRNKRKMEMAEKMDTGHNQTKKKRQSSENVSSWAGFTMVLNSFYKALITSVMNDVFKEMNQWKKNHPINKKTKFWDIKT